MEQSADTDTSCFSSGLQAIFATGAECPRPLPMNVKLLWPSIA